MAANVQIIISYKESGSTKQTEDGLDRVKKKGEDAGKGMSTFGEMATGALRRVGEIAVNALAAAGGAVVSFIGSAIQGAGDYEQSMNVFQATTGATAEQMAAAGDLAKQLGGDLTLPATSAASAGEAMTALAQAGLSVDDAMAAAKGTLQLAAAGMVDEKVAAETTATALNQFHLAGSEAVRVADLLAASISASGSSVTQTGQAVQQAGAAFAAAHVPIDVFVTLVNQMAKAGIKGSDAGTSLKTMLMRLQAPTDAAASQMRSLGINIYDAQGAMLPMREIIAQFSSSLAGLTQQQRDQAVVTIFGSDAQRAANIVLAGGADAYDKMFGAVTRAGAAQQMAAAQMMGLNGAVQGLQSQMETLALEALEPLLPIMTGVVSQAAALAGSFVGSVGPAVQSAIGFFSEVGHIVQELFLPAIAAATTALIMYGASAIAPLLVNLPAMTAVLIYQTGAFIANAVAVAAAAAPFVALAVAVGGVVYAYQNFNEKVQAATQNLLNAQPFWQQSTTALQQFGQASAETQTKLQPLADSIKTQRDLLEQNIESLGKRMSAGLVSEQQYQTEMMAINAQAASVQAASAQLDGMMQAELRAAAASQTGTQRLHDMQSGEVQLIAQTQLTEEEFVKLQKRLEETFQKGAQAVSDFVSTEIGFMDQEQAAQSSHDAATLKQQALAYAQQQAAQRAHLGQMLADYTATQVAMGNITSEQAGKIIQAIHQQFGEMKDTSAEAFLAMTSSIDHFATSGSSDVNALSGNLGSLADQAVSTRQEMDALAKKYTAELVQNFLDGKMDAASLRKELDAIPRKVESTVTVIHRNIYEEEHRMSEHEGKAGGGSVMGGTTYMVGEQGPELFTPSSSGTITPSDKLQIGGTSVTNVYLNYAGMAQSEGDVTTALRTWQMLHG